MAPKPVNLLVGHASDLTVPDLAALGVRRISLGGALSRVGWTAVINAVKQIMAEGRFDGFADLVSHGELGGIFREEMTRHGEA